MVDVLRRLAESRLTRPIPALLAMNQYGRDSWVHQQAALVPAGSVVLDVGAGGAPYRRYFQHCDYRTQDLGQLPPNDIREGGYGGIDYVSDITSIPLQDGTVDVVLCTEVLEHVPNPIAAVTEMARILRVGGRMLLTAPLASGLHQMPFHFYGGFTPFWYEYFLPAANLRVEAMVPANGFFRHYAQESTRVPRILMRATGSWQRRVAAHIIAVFCAPWFLAVCPLLCIPLDRFFSSAYSKGFTTGYYVVATKQRPLGE